jgi:hypothetical protein
MFRSAIGEMEKAWLDFEPLTLLSFYESLLEQIIEVYTPYRYVVERYSKIVQRKVYPITKDYIERNPEIVDQNVTLLKNAMELWRTATRASDAVAPMLYHYSWHCFNSFFIYTFFRWEPEHSASHGLHISKWSTNIQDIEISFLKEKVNITRGILQRLVDTWTLLGVSLIFSPYLPIWKNEEIDFIPNNYIKFNSLSVKQLLSLSTLDFEKELYSSMRGKLINCPFLINSISLPSDSLINYLIVFIASSLSRYRPALWNAVILGKNQDQSIFALRFRKALAEYTVGALPTTGLLYQVNRLIRNIMDGKFTFKKF